MTTKMIFTKITNSFPILGMHVKTWKRNIPEGGEVTLEMTEDPFPQSSETSSLT